MLRILVGHPVNDFAIGLCFAQVHGGEDCFEMGIDAGAAAAYAPRGEDAAAEEALIQNFD